MIIINAVPDVLQAKKIVFFTRFARDDQERILDPRAVVGKRIQGKS